MSNNALIYDEVHDGRSTVVNTRAKNMPTLIGIFMLSTSLFLYEILVTRLFSTMLEQHFVFFTISLAILGIGAGGFIAYKSKMKISYERLSLLLGLSYIMTVMIIYKLPYLGIFVLYALISSLPFVIGGMILSLAFLDNKGISNKLYFADLLGSTLGSILIIPLMDKFGFMKTLFIIGSLGIISSLFFTTQKSSRKTRIVSIFMLTAIMVLIFQGKALEK